MKIYDSHLHLDEGLPLSEAFSLLLKRCESADVLGGLIIHLNNSSWGPRDLQNILLDNPNYYMAVNPDLNSSSRDLKKELSAINLEVCKAIKIHPRKQKVNLSSRLVFRLAEIAQDINLPVVICSFDDGSWSRIGLNSEQFLRLADRFPKVKFLWAHSGGHRILDFMFMARRTDNVYLDSSYTQSYFFKGSVPSDLNYAIESLPTRFMFGSDFENLEYRDEVKKLVNFYLTENHKRELFFSDNYLRFFGING